MRNVIILEEAAEDIETARDFYEARQAGIGDYFADSITNDILTLRQISRIHSQRFGFYRMLGTRFRFGIYYRERGNDTVIAAVLDLRRDPKWIRQRLRQRQKPNG